MYGSFGRKRCTVQLQSVPARGEEALVDLRRRAPGARRRPGERDGAAAPAAPADQARLLRRPREQAHVDRLGCRTRCGHGVPPRANEPQPVNRCQRVHHDDLHTARALGCRIIIRIPSSDQGEHTVAARRTEPRSQQRSGVPGMTVGHLTLQEERSRTVKASERVAQDIVRDIVRRGLQTGDRLPLEAAMVEEYGVSRTSLREALRILEVQGLISLKPGPGGGPVVGTVEPSHLARTAALYFHLSARHLRRRHGRAGRAHGGHLRPVGGGEPGSRSPDGAVDGAGAPVRHARLPRPHRRLPLRRLRRVGQPRAEPPHPGGDPHRHPARRRDDGSRRSARLRSSTSTKSSPGSWRAATGSGRRK